MDCIDWSRTFARNNQRIFRLSRILKAETALHTFIFTHYNFILCSFFSLYNVSMIKYAFENHCSIAYSNRLPFLKNYIYILNFPPKLMLLLWFETNMILIIEVIFIYLKYHFISLEFLILVKSLKTDIWVILYGSWITFKIYFYGDLASLCRNSECFLLISVSLLAP